MKLERIGLIGYGEVGKIFSAGLLKQAGVTGVCAWDLKFAQAATQATERAHAAQAGIDAHSCMQALCEESELILSAVTASATLAVAQEAAAFIRPGTIFLDLNSASPGTKQQAATLIEAAGGHYVEAGVMTSVPPYGIKVPMLLGGVRANALAPALTDWGMDAKVVSDRIGVASAIKMCRSVMIKGTGSSGHRKLQHRAGLWRGRPCAAHAAGNLPRHRLERARRLFFQPRGAAWPAPCGRNARIGTHGARGRFRAIHGRRHRREAAVGGRPGQGGCVGRRAQGRALAGLCRCVAGGAQTVRSFTP
jgi:hypothetical protein